MVNLIHDDAFKNASEEELRVMWNDFCEQKIEFLPYTFLARLLVVNSESTLIKPVLSYIRQRPADPQVESAKIFQSKEMGAELVESMPSRRLIVSGALHTTLNGDALSALKFQQTNLDRMSPSLIHLITSYQHGAILDAAKNNTTLPQLIADPAVGGLLSSIPPELKAQYTPDLFRTLETPLESSSVEGILSCLVNVAESMGCLDSSAMLYPIIRMLANPCSSQCMIMQESTGKKCACGDVLDVALKLWRHLYTGTSGSGEVGWEEDDVGEVEVTGWETNRRLHDFAFLRHVWTCATSCTSSTAGKLNLCRGTLPGRPHGSGQHQRTGKVVEGVLTSFIEGLLEPADEEEEGGEFEGGYSFDEVAAMSFLVHFKPPATSFKALFVGNRGVDGDVAFRGDALVRFATAVWRDPLVADEDDVDEGEDGLPLMAFDEWQTQVQSTHAPAAKREKTISSGDMALIEGRLTSPLAVVGGVRRYGRLLTEWMHLCVSWIMHNPRVSVDAMKIIFETAPWLDEKFAACTWLMQRPDEAVRFAATQFDTVIRAGFAPSPSLSPPDWAGLLLPHLPWHSPSSLLKDKAALLSSIRPSWVLIKDVTTDLPPFKPNQTYPIQPYAYADPIGELLLDISADSTNFTSVLKVFSELLSPYSLPPDSPLTCFLADVANHIPFNATSPSPCDIPAAPTSSSSSYIDRTHPLTPYLLFTSSWFDEVGQDPYHAPPPSGRRLRQAYMRMTREVNCMLEYETRDNPEGQAHYRWERLGLTSRLPPVSPARNSDTVCDAPLSPTVSSTASIASSCFTSLHDTNGDAVSPCDNQPPPIQPSIRPPLKLLTELMGPDEWVAQPPGATTAAGGRSFGGGLTFSLTGGALRTLTKPWFMLETALFASLIYGETGDVSVRTDGDETACEAALDLAAEEYVAYFESCLKGRTVSNHAEAVSILTSSLTYKSLGFMSGWLGGDASVFPHLLARLMRQVSFKVDAICPPEYFIKGEDFVGLTYCCVWFCRLWWLLVGDRYGSDIKKTFHDMDNETEEAVLTANFMHLRTIHILQTQVWPLVSSAILTPPSPSASDFHLGPLKTILVAQGAITAWGSPAAQIAAREVWGSCVDEALKLTLGLLDEGYILTNAEQLMKGLEPLRKGDTEGVHAERLRKMYAETWGDAVEAQRDGGVPLGKQLFDPRCLVLWKNFHLKRLMFRCSPVMNAVLPLHDHAGFAGAVSDTQFAFFYGNGWEELFKEAEALRDAWCELFRRRFGSLQNLPVADEKFDIHISTDTELVARTFAFIQKHIPDRPPLQAHDTVRRCANIRDTYVVPSMHDRFALLFAPVFNAAIRLMAPTSVSDCWLNSNMHFVASLDEMNVLAELQACLSPVADTSTRADYILSQCVNLFSHKRSLTSLPLGAVVAYVKSVSNVAGFSTLKSITDGSLTTLKHIRPPQDQMRHTYPLEVRLCRTRQAMLPVPVEVEDPAARARMGPYELHMGLGEEWKAGACWSCDWGSVNAEWERGRLGDSRWGLAFQKEQEEKEKGSVGCCSDDEDEDEWADEDEEGGWSDTDGEDDDEEEEEDFRTQFDRCAAFLVYSEPPTAANPEIFDDKCMQHVDIAHAETWPVPQFTYAFKWADYDPQSVTSEAVLSYTIMPSSVCDKLFKTGKGKLSPLGLTLAQMLWRDATYNKESYSPVSAASLLTTAWVQRQVAFSAYDPVDDQHDSGPGVCGATFRAVGRSYLGEVGGVSLLWEP